MQSSFIYFIWQLLSKQKLFPFPAMTLVIIHLKILPPDFPSTILPSPESKKEELVYLQCMQPCWSSETLFYR